MVGYQDNHTQDPYELIDKVARILQQGRRPDRCLFLVARHLRSALHADAAFILSLEDGCGQDRILAASFADGHQSRRFSKQEKANLVAYLHRQLKRRRTLIIPDINSVRGGWAGGISSALGKKVSMLSVRLRVQTINIGSLVILKSAGDRYAESDLRVLRLVAFMTASALEERRLQAVLENCHRRVEKMSLARDRIMHQLSHALKTPLAVLSASFRLLQNEERLLSNQKRTMIRERIQRNLDRLLAIEYDIEDILRERDPSAQQVLAPFPQEPQGTR